MTIPQHHKQLAQHLRARFEAPATVGVYRDDSGKRPIAIGTFGRPGSRFFSSIGLCDVALELPPGRFEFAAIGSLEWLPNALVSSIYWLSGRHFDTWPIVCEDVVRSNAKSTYRHMAYWPSTHSVSVDSGIAIRWLLGIPITDGELTLTGKEIADKVAVAFPHWLFDDAC